MGHVGLATLFYGYNLAYNHPLLDEKANEYNLVSYDDNAIGLYTYGSERRVRFYLFIKRYCASYRASRRMTDMSIDPTWNDRLLDFAKANGVNIIGKPGWYLAASCS